MIPGFPGISITRLCKLSDAAIRRRAAGDETPLEILTIAAGQSVSRGAHGLSLARGIRLIALTQLPCRGDEREEGLSGFMTTMRRRRVSDGSRRCRIISRRRRDIIRKLEDWGARTHASYLIARQVFTPRHFFPFLHGRERDESFEAPYIYIV